MYTKGVLKMMKSIRILLLLALLQISLSSCLLWKGTILTLKQSSAYFLVFIVLASGLCAGMNFFYTRDQDVHSIINSQKKVKLFYSTLLVLNLVGVCLVLSETILTQTAVQQELVDLFLPSFFFLFGIDLLVFLPLEKYSRELGSTLNKKKTVVLTVLATLLFLRNPMTVLSIVFYVGLGFIFARFLFPKSMRREFSFYGHVIRDILLVSAVCIFF